MKLIDLAMGEAADLGHNFVAPEHLFLGLLRLESCNAARVLTEQGVDLGEVRAEVEGVLGEVTREPPGGRPLTPQAVTVVSHAREAAKDLGLESVGSEHLLLGLLREGDCHGIQILRDLGVDYGSVLDRVRTRSLEERLGATVSPKAEPSLGTLAALAAAGAEAEAIGSDTFDTGHVLLALLAARDMAPRWAALGIDPVRARTVLLEAPESETP